LNEKANYRVTRASKEQINLIFDNFYKWEEKREIAIVFIAFDDSENIIGYLVAEEKEVPPPLNGTDWFI
jgi:hypothetical protein